MKLSPFAFNLKLVLGRIEDTVVLVALLHSHARFRPFSGLLFPVYDEGHLDSIMI